MSNADGWLIAIAICLLFALILIMGAKVNQQEQDIQQLIQRIEAIESHDGT